MSADASAYALSCFPCQRSRVTQSRQGLSPTDPTGASWQGDLFFIRRLPSSRAGASTQVVLLLVDERTGFTLAQILPNKSAAAVRAGLYRALDRDENCHAADDEVVDIDMLKVDSGCEFRGVFEQAVAAMEPHVQLRPSAPHDIGGHGLAERNIRTIRAYLSKVWACEQNDAPGLLEQNAAPGEAQDRLWPEVDFATVLDHAVSNINDVSNRMRGRSPRELFFGERPQSRRLEGRLNLVPDGPNVEEQQAARQAYRAASLQELRETRAEMAEDYDEARRARDVRFEVGDQVLMSQKDANVGKFGKTLAGGWRNQGPYRVHEVLEHGRSVSLEAGGQVQHKRVSVRLLRHFIPEIDLPVPPEDIVRWANIMRFAPAEMPTGNKKYSTYDTRTRRRLERAEQEAQEAQG
jgi:hypothetical protein